MRSLGMKEVSVDRSKAIVLGVVPHKLEEFEELSHIRFHHMDLFEGALEIKERCPSLIIYDERCGIPAFKSGTGEHVCHCALIEAICVEGCKRRGQETDHAVVDYRDDLLFPPETYCLGSHRFIKSEGMTVQFCVFRELSFMRRSPHGF
jgi:hypothetical protein